MKYKLYPLHDSLKNLILLRNRQNNSLQCLIISHFFWTQNGHSNKARLNFKRQTKDPDGHKNGHNLRWYFQKIKKGIFLAILPILLVGCVFSAEKKEIINSWQELFPDHLERVYIIMKDGATFPHTSQNEVMVDTSIGRLEEKLRKVKGKNYSIKEIAVIIHNHRNKKRFTREDYKQYWTLKSYGFDGRFLLYCHRTKEVYPIEKKKKP